MNAEPFSMSEATARLGRIAILWRGDAAARRSVTPETSRFLAGAGFRLDYTVSGVAVYRPVGAGPVTP